jgi:hypothetical protein
VAARFDHVRAERFFDTSEFLLACADALFLICAAEKASRELIFFV